MISLRHTHQELRREQAPRRQHDRLFTAAPAPKVFERKRRDSVELTQLTDATQPTEPVLSRAIAGVWTQAAGREPFGERIRKQLTGKVELLPGG
jgi:hypothetical protein